MFRLGRALIATAGMVSLATIGIQATAHAATPDFNPIIDCNFTVTAAGNGMSVYSPNFSAVVATLQTGQVYDLFRTETTSRNNITYHNDESFGQVGDWYPIRTADNSVVYMTVVPNTCTIDNE